MTAATLTECLRGAIALGLGIARGQLIEARGRLRQKDSTGNRASVAECWARMDALLDLHLEVEGARRRPVR
jgi:hypothetical protein